MLLALTNEKDLQVSNVLRRLNKRDIPWLRLNSEDLLRGSYVDFDFSPNSGDPAVMLRNAGRDNCRIEDISCVWSSRFSVCPYFDEKDSLASDIARREYGAAREALCLALSHANWVTPFHMACQVNNKLYVLREAIKFGLDCPRTVVTQDPEIAKSFIDACDRPVITKQLSSSLGRAGQSKMIFTSSVEPEHMSKLQLVKNCPTLFQEKIEKELECRVVIVGKETFAVATEPLDPSNETDWRRLTQELVLRYPIQLPKSLLKATHDLVRSLKLRYAAIDMIKDKEGKFIFLELNPNGIWDDLQPVGGYDIDGAMADLLQSLAKA